MKLKDEEEPYYLVDFCRRKDCQQIKVVDTNDEEIKDFLTGIFENKRKQGNAIKADGTLVKVRSISTNKTSCKQLMNMPLYKQEFIHKNV